MQPALTSIQQEIRAAELRQRAERQRTTSRVSRRSRRREAARAIESAQASAPAPAFGALFLGHGFFGREHGSHA